MQKNRDNAYRRHHDAVRRTRGRAADQLCVGCNGKAHHWSQVHDTDGMNPWTDYRPLCVKCHWAYDGITLSKFAHDEKRALGIHNGKRSNNTSGIPGVHYHKATATWRVQVKRKHGGVFKKIEDAITARNDLAREIYGPESKDYSISDHRT